MKIVIEYTNEKDSLFMVTVENGQINPYQMLALGSYFEFEGKYALSKIRAIEEMAYQQTQDSKVATLKPKVLKPL